MFRGNYVEAICTIDGRSEAVSVVNVATSNCEISNVESSLGRSDISARDAAATVHEPTWTTVASWSGSGQKETESFSTMSREWRIKWATKNEAMVGAGIFQIFVKRADDGGLVSLAANAQGVQSDVSYVRSQPGRYYLQFNSANVDYAVTIEEMR